MSRESILIILAALIIIAPFAGFPLTWLVWILPVLGFFLLIIGVSLRRDRHARTAIESSETF